MRRADVRTLIETAINDLSMTIGFGSGEITEFNSQPDKPYPFAWLSSLANNPELTDIQLMMDNWNCEITIAKKDATDAIAAESEDIIDVCDEIAKTILQRINQVVSGYKLLILKSISIDPFTKKHADCLSGVTLSFTLNTPDTENRC